MWNENKNFPGNGDPRPFFGDFSGPHKNCKGHPGTSHGKGVSFDLLYFTNQSGNFTQRYTSRHGFQYELVRMWNGKSPLGTMNRERNVRFWLLLREVFPFCRIHIRDYASDYIQDVMSADDLGLWKRIKNEDSSSEYNHWSHVHVALEQDAIPGEKTVDWEKIESMIDEMEKDFCV